MLMDAADYRESLRRLQPTRVRQRPQGRERRRRAAAGAGHQRGRRHLRLRSLCPSTKPLMTARQGTSGKTVNRMLHIDETSTDLLYKLEAVRLVCKSLGLRPALSHP